MYKGEKKINIKDILQRNSIDINIMEIEKLILGKVVLVTGGGGSIGSELCRQIIKYNPKKLVIFDIYENNLYDIETELKQKYPEIEIYPIIGSIRDINKINWLFNKYLPNLVFHAAAHKHVPLMEESPLEAIKNNVIGTNNLVNCANSYNTNKFILISSDKAVNPTSVMGATKRLCEMIVQAKNEESNTDYISVRFGNVLESNGSVIPLFKKQIKDGGPVTVTHKNITRFFMTITEAVELILQAVSNGNGGEIFVLDMGEPVNIYDLAVSLIESYGYKADIDIKVEITGLRPGEKLYEEILTKEEGIKATKHNKIFVAKPINITQGEVESKIKILDKTISNEELSNKEIREMIGNLIDNFQNKENMEVIDE